MLMCEECMHAWMCIRLYAFVCISVCSLCMCISSHRSSDCRVCVCKSVYKCVCMWQLGSRPVTGRSQGQLKCPGANQGKEYFISPPTRCIHKYTFAHTCTHTHICKHTHRLKNCELTDNDVKTRLAFFMHFH